MSIVMVRNHKKINTTFILSPQDSKLIQIHTFRKAHNKRINHISKILVILGRM